MKTKTLVVMAWILGFLLWTIGQASAYTLYYEPSNAKVTKELLPVSDSDNPEEGFEYELTLNFSFPDDISVLVLFESQDFEILSEEELPTNWYASPFSLNNVSSTGSSFTLSGKLYFEGVVYNNISYTFPISEGSENIGTIVSELEGYEGHEALWFGSRTADNPVNEGTIRVLLSAPVSSPYLAISSLSDKSGPLYYGDAVPAGAVPSPATAVLVVSGCVALIAWRKWQKSKTA